MASYQIKERLTGEIKVVEENKATIFLYGNIIGRLLVKLLSLRFISELAGFYLNSTLSKAHIPKFITKNHLDMSEYEITTYQSFNDFFTRKIQLENRPIDSTSNSFISPCDAKLSVHQINHDSCFAIKGSYYRVEDLIGNLDLAREYIDGYALIFRLSVDDYHRYCYVDSGFQKEVNYLGKEFHTVRPIALKHYNIYKRNFRTWTILETENFNEIIQVEVGAMLVGKIVNHRAYCKINKGEEKGYFMYGGSTIVLLVKEKVIQLDQDIIDASANNLEITVKYGEKIGQKIN